MTSAELALCVVRREHAQFEGTIAIPAVSPPTHHHLSDNQRVVEYLMTLPPPLPVRDGGLGGVLIGRGLVLFTEIRRVDAHDLTTLSVALRQLRNLALLS